MKSNPIPLPVIPAPAPSPADNSVKPSTSKTSHQPSTIVTAPAPSPSPSPAVSEKKNLTLSVYCSVMATPNTLPQNTHVAPLKFSSTNLPNDKYTISMSFYPSNGYYSYSPNRQTVVLQENPMLLKDIAVTNKYTNYAGAPTTPSSDKPIAAFLSAFQCLNTELPAINNHYALAKGPFYITLTNSSNKSSYVFELLDKDYINLGNYVNESQRGHKGSVTLTEMEQTKTTSSTQSNAITGTKLLMKASCIGAPLFAKITFSTESTKTLSSNKKYTLDMIFMNPLKIQGNFAYDVNGMTVPIVTTPTLLNDITISTSSNNTNPGTINDPNTKQLAGFLNIFICNQPPFFTNNTFVWAKGPFKFRFTEQGTNNTYEYTLSNEDYINLGFAVNGITKYSANNLKNYQPYSSIVKNSSGSITLTN